MIIGTITIFADEPMVLRKGDVDCNEVDDSDDVLIYVRERL